MPACPTCGATTQLHEYRGTRKPTPSPGDVAVCWKCGEVLRFTDGLGVELYPADEFEERVSPANKTLVRSLQESIRSRREN